MRFQAGNLVRHVWHQWVRPVLLVVFVVTAARSSLADWYVVPTGSMKPNIVEGDRIFVNKLAYDLTIPFTSWRLWRWSGPARSEVVVLYAPGNERRMVKRVVGMPGDTLELRGNRLIINDQVGRYGPADAGGLALPDVTTVDGYLLPMEELTGSASHPIMISSALSRRAFFGPVVVPAEHYFVLGDNRDASADSRWFGFVHRDRIIGRSPGIVISLAADDGYRPRLQRSLRKLP